MTSPIAGVKPPFPQRLRQAIHERVAAVPAVKRVARRPYYAWQRLRHGRVVRNNQRLKGRHAGERCFIVLTGVSASQIPFTLLGQERVFGCAHLYKHPDFQLLDVDFYVEVEPIRNLYSRQLVWEVNWPGVGMDVGLDTLDAALASFYFQAEQARPDLDAAIKQVPFDFFSRIERACGPDTVFFLHADNRRVFEQRGMFADRDVAYLANMAPPILDAQPLSADLAGRFTFMDGSYLCSVAAAIDMGFAEIYVCGGGYSYQPRQEYHFYDQYRFPAALSERQARDMAERLGARWGVELYRLDRDASGYRPMFVRHVPVGVKHDALNRFAAARGVTIYNVVPEGFTSPVYKSVTRREVIEDVLRVPASRRVAAVGV